MSRISVTRDRVPEAADVLARAMLEDGAARYILPDPVERLVAHRSIYADLMARALEEGRVDAWGDPIVGVAIWLRRPPIPEPTAPSEVPRAEVTAADTSTPPQRRASPPRWPSPPRRPSPLPPDAARRAERFAAVLRHLREIARPDEHAYLDSIGVLPDERRRGIATQLLDAGHAWADAAGLPCALDTLTDENVRFYARRGYAVVATAPVPGSSLRITAMRRARGT